MWPRVPSGVHPEVAEEQERICRWAGLSAVQETNWFKLIDENFVDTYSESVIAGTVVNITEREAIIDINAKSEGVISLNEFRYNPDLAVGDTVNF